MNSGFFVFCTNKPLRKYFFKKVNNVYYQKLLSKTFKESVGVRKLVASKILLSFILLIGLLGFVVSEKTEAASKPQYTITIKSNPYKKQYINYGTYNKYTKHYYVLRSYLERLEKLGGGTLVLKKGTYTITNTLYVPSNVTIKFENGVVIKKGAKTGTSKIKPAKSIFQLVKPSKANKKKVYGKYSGEKNISFIGTGSVVFDLNYYKDSIAIIMGHNSNVVVKGIQFKNMHSGHFIEMDASKNVKVYNNAFMNHKPSPNKNKEAINLDTPDRNTKGWSQEWSKFDGTANLNVLIQNNTFKNLERAVGTHKYTQGKYHTDVKVIGNKIENMVQDGIRVMNWDKPIIKDNKIKNIADGKGSYRGILMSGVKYPQVTNNRIEKAARPIQIMPWKNSGPGSNYKVTYNVLSENNKTMMSKTTYVKNVGETIIRINNKYNVFDRDTEKLTTKLF